MSLRVIEGVVEDGRVRLNVKITLAENTKVYVIVLDAPVREIVHIRSPRLANAGQASLFRKRVFDIDA
jgi:hypothetical protein